MTAPCSPPWPTLTIYASSPPLSSAWPTRRAVWPPIQALDLRSKRPHLSSLIKVAESPQTALVVDALLDLTCYVEVFTIRGLDGNRELYRRLEELADELLAAPHWVSAPY